MNNIQLDDDGKIDELAQAKAVSLICLIFLRVERDSAAGCALRRALGFSGSSDLAKAARDFGVTEQYMCVLQQSIEIQLGSLSFLAKKAHVPLK